MPPPSTPVNPYQADAMREVIRDLHGDKEIQGSVRSALCLLTENGAHVAGQIAILLDMVSTQANRTDLVLEGIRDTNKRVDDTNRCVESSNQRIAMVESAVKELASKKVAELESLMAQVQNDMKIQRLEMERATDAKLKELTANYDEKLRAQAVSYDAKLKDAADAKTASDEKLRELQMANAVQQGKLNFAYTAVGLLLTTLGVVATFLAIRKDGGETRESKPATTVLVAPAGPTK